MWKILAEGFRQRPDPTSHHFGGGGGGGGGGINSRPASQQSKYSKMGGGTSSHLSFHSRQQHRSRHIQGLPPGGIVGSVTGAGFSVYPHRDEIMLNEKYFPRDEFFAQQQQQFGDGSNDGDDLTAHHQQQPHLKHPHLQVRGLCYDKPTVNGHRIHLLDDISLEARAGEILGILATSGILCLNTGCGV